jgi:hypothetical protein
MNLVEKGKELEYVPEPKLIEMARNPEGQYPQFLVLSEIQKRNQMRRMYKNQMAKMNQPTTTVAEESVMELAGQGAVPMMDSLSSLSSPEGGLRSMAPTLMKSGKKTEIEKDEAELSEELRELLAKDRRYAQQYKDYESRERFFPPLVPENFIVSDDKYDRLKRSGAYMREGNLQDYRPFLALLGALSGESGPRYMPESKVKGLEAMVEATRKEKQMQQMGMQEGGITQMQSGRSTALEQSFMPPGRNPMGVTPPPAFLQSIKERYTDPDGTFNYSQALKDGFNATTLALIAFPEPTTTAIGTGLKGLGTLLKSPFSSKAKDSLLRTFGRRQARKDEGKLLPTGRQTIDDAPVPAGYFEGLGKQYLKESVKPTATRLSALAALGIMNTPDESTEIVKEELTEAQKRAASSLKDLEKLLDKPTDTTTTEKQGFGSDDFLTLAQLGGILGGATNLGEAAMGIGNLAGQIQTTRRKGKLEGLQGRVLEAQAAKYEADIANMKPTQINAQLQTIENLIQAAIDSGNQDEVSELFLYQQLLNKRLLELQGIDIPTGGDILDKNRVA